MIFKISYNKPASCEEKKISRHKWLRKMYLKNVVITYKSRILKLKIQQKVFNKKDAKLYV